MQTERSEFYFSGTMKLAQTEKLKLVDFSVDFSVG